MAAPEPRTTPAAGLSLAPRSVSGLSPSAVPATPGHAGRRQLSSSLRAAPEHPPGGKEGATCGGCQAGRRRPGLSAARRKRQAPALLSGERRRVGGPYLSASSTSAARRHFSSWSSGAAAAATPSPPQRPAAATPRLRRAPLSRRFPLRLRRRAGVTWCRPPRPPRAGSEGSAPVCHGARLACSVGLGAAPSVSFTLAHMRFWVLVSCNVHLT